MSSLLFSILNSIDQANAQSTTTTVDTTPKYSSICIVNKDIRGIVYGEPLKILNANGDLDLIVLDRNYTSTFGDFAFSILTKKNIIHPDYFSIWSWDSMLLQTKNLPHGMDVVAIYIDDQIFPLKFVSEMHNYDTCKYGNESVSWRKYTVGYKLSEEIQEALRNSLGKSNVKIIYGVRDGNKTYKTEFPIGNQTIEGWKKIDKLYRQRGKNK